MKNRQTKVVEFSEIQQTARILIMDDEEIICSFLMEILEKYGFTASIAKDGIETIMMYKQSLEQEKPFDIIIMDLTIPGGMGGKDTVKEILDIDSNAKCIISSGYAKDHIMANYA